MQTHAACTGNAKTSLVVTIGPALSNVTETISSLLFGKRAMKVATHAKVNENIDYKALSLKLQVRGVVFPHMCFCLGIFYIH